MSCKSASKVVPQNLLTYNQLVMSEFAPCDVNYNIQDESATLKIFSFEQYLNNQTSSAINKIFYSLDCSCKICSLWNYGHGLLWALKSYDLTDEDQAASFEITWNYVIDLYPGINDVAQGQAPEPPSILPSYFCYSGPFSEIPIDSTQATSWLIQTADIGTIKLQTGTLYIMFHVILPPGKLINTVLDMTINGQDITSQYQLIGTIQILNSDGNLYTHNQYVMIVGQEYSINHEHFITYS